MSTATDLIQSLAIIANSICIIVLANLIGRRSR